MAANVRSILARLLPWAALAVMTVFFFVQVRARERADARAREAARAAPRPTPAPARAAPVATSDPQEVVGLTSELATRTSELERAQQDLAALRAEGEASVAALERVAAARAAQAERAAALVQERDAWQRTANEKVEALARQLAEAEARLATPERSVEGWLAAVAGDAAEARARALTEARAADDTQKAALRGLWLAASEPKPSDACADIVALWEPGDVASGLAGQIIAATPEDVDPEPLLRRLHAHVMHVQGMLFILWSPSPRVLREALPWLDPAAGGWSDEARTTFGGILGARLDTADPALLKLLLAGVGRLGSTSQTVRLGELLAHDDAEVRLMAAWALLRVLGPQDARKRAGRTVAALLAPGGGDLTAQAVHVARGLLGEGEPGPGASIDSEAARLRARLAGSADG